MPGANIHTDETPATLRGVAADVAPVAAIDTASAAAPEPAPTIRKLENLRGLVEDLTNTQIAQTRENLDQVLAERLGPGANVDALRVLFSNFPN